MANDILEGVSVPFATVQDKLIAGDKRPRYILTGQEKIFVVDHAGQINCKNHRHDNL